MGLFGKNFTPESIAKQVSRDWSLLSDAINALSSEKPEIKFKSGKALIKLSEDYSEKLYPNWNNFVNLLTNENTFLKVIGITILAHLSKVDKENRFEEIFEVYYGLLDNDSMVTAANVAGYSGIICIAKPNLQKKITERLIGIDKTHHSDECKNIIKGKAILSFSEYFKETTNKEKIVEFARKELNNTRPATRKKAEKFVEKLKETMI